MDENTTLNDFLFHVTTCDEIGPGFTIAGLAFIFIILISSIVGNTLICIAVVKFPYLQSSSDLFIFSLAVSDIIVAVSVLPFDIVYWIAFPRWPLGGYVCNLWNSFFFLFLTASVLNLTCISTDRYLAVVFPLRYCSWMTPRLTKIMITIVWLYSITIGILIFLLLNPPEDGTYSFNLNPKFHGFLLIGNVLIPFIIMIILYSKIYVIARQHARRTRTTSSNTSSTFARELRVAKMLGIVVLCFVMCWLPFEITNVIIPMDKGVENCAVEIADTVTCWLAYLHTSLNPLLYTFNSAEFRRAFKKLLSRTEGPMNIEIRAVNSQSKHAGRSDENNGDPP